MAWEGINAGTSLPGMVSDDTALSASQFRFVQLGTAVIGGVWRAATAGQKGVVGVLQNKPALGEGAHICGGGVTKVEAGVAITKGAAIMSDAVGRAITAAATTSNHVYGYAAEAAGAAGEIITMVFGYHGPVTNNA